MLTHYGDSPSKAIMSVYPEFKMEYWMFDFKPQGFWQDQKNRRQYFDWLGKRMGIKSLEEWYRLKTSDAHQAGGRGLFSHHYDNSLYKAMFDVYPEYRWEFWKFKKMPKKGIEYQNEKQNLLTKIEEKLDVTCLEDWYRVSSEQLSHFRAFHFVVAKGGLFNILQTVYPFFPWDRHKFSYKQRKSNQWKLFKAIESILSSHEVYEDYKHPDIQFYSSGRSIQFDVFIPSLKLAVEYQGFQHFQDNAIFGPASISRDRDAEKKKLCRDAGITLIDIPYWWKGDKETLIATIHYFRPDVISSPGNAKPLLKKTKSN
eukprot:TRINITY_DN4702_c0_g1_i2.p1 TRINITY_DN4702_c0_g1~~TRINITY_DN4702_c0_g1_i2.p1  ORF type:complete len:314 (-),score=59.44 TRINITY_DN4702_c0_g1_i2:174-1115(-)